MAFDRISLPRYHMLGVLFISKPVCAKCLLRMAAHMVDSKALFTFLNITHVQW